MTPPGDIASGHLVTPERREAACNHEAGHAVVAWALGLPLDRVTILAVGADSTVPGCDGVTSLSKADLVTHLDPDGVRRHDRYLDLIAYYLGGEIGQRRCWSGKVPHDASCALKYARLLAPESPEGLLAEWVGYVKHLLLVQHKEEHRLLRDELLSLPPDPHTSSHVPLANMSAQRIVQVVQAQSVTQ